MDRTSQPADHVRGTVRVPGDKSISHRVLMLGAVAEGVSRIRHLPEGADVRSTRGVLEALGVEIATAADGEWRIHGRGLRGLRRPASVLDCGNSGTTMRLLAGLIAGQGFAAELSGDASLTRRPMTRIVEPLRAMGARVTSGPEGRPPLSLEAADLHSVTVRPPVASAQVKSCVLLAGLNAVGETRVVELAPTRDHTERLLRRMGADLELEASPEATIRLWPPRTLAPLEGVVPGDVSSAAYWLTAASLLPGSDLELLDVGVNPSRCGVLEVLREWGASIDVLDERLELGEPVATLRVRGAVTRLRGGLVEASRVPGLIDELPVLAALGPLTELGVEFRGAGELRVKESDRIASTCAALRAVGAAVDEFPDGLAVGGGAAVRGGSVDADGDHRIALAFATLGLASESGIRIAGAEVASVSYPGFFDELERVASREPRG